MNEYFEYTHRKGHICLKWLYYKNRYGFLKKIKLKHPTGTDAKIKNFIRI